MDPALGALAFTALVALLLSAVHLRCERAASRTLAAEQRAALAQLTEEVTSLREALLSSGAVERSAKLPAPPLVDPLADVELERPTSSATRTAEAFRRRTTRDGATTGNEPVKGSG
jgi:hypothetical protein